MISGSILSHRGYSLPLTALTDEKLIKCKQDLTIIPYVEKAEYSYGVVPIKLYTLTDKRIYMPRHYGLNNFGAPETDKLTTIEYPIRSRLSTNLKPQPHQIPIMEKVTKDLKETYGGVISIYCGGGKCLGKNTKVMMYDGTLKKVQHVKVGDVLMGDDSGPRNVLSLARGREMMYDISPKKGEKFGNSYIINESHILSLKRGNEPIDISLMDYLRETKSTAVLVGYKVPVTFPYKEVPNDPYNVGYWLALSDKKHIPEVYKYNSRDVQLKVLAGFIDANVGANIDAKGTKKYIFHRRKMCKDIVYICNSLGFSAFTKKTSAYTKKNPFTKKTSPFTKKPCKYKVSIKGGKLKDLPLRYDSISLEEDVDDEELLTSAIYVTRLKVDDYYGFEIDGNHRFLLGDFQVTHNTALAIMLACTLKVKTLVVCHTTSLMNQWKERIEEFVPAAKIGIVQQSVTEVSGKDIVIASLSSVAQKTYKKDEFDSVGFVVWDEIHLMCTNLFSNAFTKLTTKHSIGLSATPYRKDKCDVIFNNHIGPVLYTLKREKNETIVAKCVKLLLPEESIEVVYDRRGKPQYTTTVISVVNNPCRTARIVDMIIEYVTQGRKVLVLSEYIKHLRDIRTQIGKRIIELKNDPINTVRINFIKALDFTYDLYIGEMKTDARKDSEQKDVILGTYKLASVGMDIPKLNTLILASPRKEIEQSVGRILRKESSIKVQHKPLIVDIIDNNGLFVNQSNIRKLFYKKYGYTIEHINMLPDGNIKSKRVISTLLLDDVPKLEIKMPQQTQLGKIVQSKMSNVQNPESAPKRVKRDYDDEFEEVVCEIDDD